MVIRIVSLFDSKAFSLTLQPLTAFAELSYGRRDFAKTEGRKTEKGMVERVAEGKSKMAAVKTLTLCGVTCQLSQTNWDSL